MTTRPARSAIPVRGRFVGAALLAVLASVAGCNIVGSLVFLLSPPQIRDPEFTFPENARVAIVVDVAQPQFRNPVFTRALQERVDEILRRETKKADPPTLIPWEQVVDLRKSSSNFKRWSVQHIGRELGATHVLHVVIDDLSIRPTPDYPLLAPQVLMRCKVIDVDAATEDARVWPTTRSWNSITCNRQEREASDTDPDVGDIETRKLGYDAAWFVTEYFVPVDLEEARPVER